MYGTDAKTHWDHHVSKTIPFCQSQNSAYLATENDRNVTEEIKLKSE